MIEQFRARPEKAGIGYQTLINAALRDAFARVEEKPLTVSALRRVLREELDSA